MCSPLAVSPNHDFNNFVQCKKNVHHSCTSCCTTDVVLFQVTLFKSFF